MVIIMLVSMNHETFEATKNNATMGWEILKDMERMGVHNEKIVIYDNETEEIYEL